MKPNDVILVGMGQLCAQVAHDMRSPLSCICAGIAALREPDRSPEDRAELFQIMGNCAEKLNRMATELLEYRCADQIHKSPTDIKPLIQSVCAELKSQATANGVELTWTCDAPQPLSMDGSKMERVLQNLVQNAIQAVRGCTPSQVTVSAAIEGQCMVIRVRDTGPGLPQDHLHKLFKESFTTKGRSGNGLGLTYCHAVILGHGGTITAHTLPEGGAEFIVRLPLPLPETA